MLATLRPLLILTGLAAVCGTAWAVQENNDYLVTDEDPDELIIDPPQLPDIRRYSMEAVLKKIGKPGPASIDVRRMVDVEPLDEYTGSDGRLALWAARQRSNPVAIVIDSGLVTPKDLARELDASYFEEQEPGVFIARLPLVVGHGAVFHVGKEVEALRLSQDGGSFLINDGRTFITGTRLLAWSERNAAPARYREASEFRPFLTSWGGAELYVAGSTVESLGYDESKSYGLSITQYPSGQQKRLQRAHPRGWIIDSSFRDMWFGFYCYEARELVVVRNLYKDNIVYGVDPHDRSEGLIIAENKISGTRQKHGLIISREVNESFIFRNESFDNALSGFMIDRQSRHNIVADNLAYNNGSDGFTVYESPENLFWQNRAVSNTAHGIRVRNSIDVRLYHNQAIANGYSGIYGHVKDLRGTDRNFQLDPFSPLVSLVVVGGELIHNGSGPLTIDQPLSLELYNVKLLAPTHSSGLQLEGALGEHQTRILDLLVRQRRAVIIEPDDGSTLAKGKEARE